MKLQFDAQQQYQVDAVSAVVDIFDGHRLEQPEFAVIQAAEGTGLFEGQVQTEMGIGNHLSITDETLRKNIRSIQQRNEIEISNPDVDRKSVV